MSKVGDNRLLILIRTTIVASFVVFAFGNCRADGPANSKNIIRGAGVVVQPLRDAASNNSGNAGLFFGVNDFNDDSISRLQYAVHDAVELAYTFVVELKLIPAENCILAISGRCHDPRIQKHEKELKDAGARVVSANRARVLEALVDLQAKAKNKTNILVVTMSSHGFNDGANGGKPYVMPCDGLPKLLAATAVPLDDIEGGMKASTAGHRLLLIDACQERITGAKSALGAGSGLGMPPQLAALLAQPTGQSKVASCSPNQFSYEHHSLGGVGHGIFSYAFLEALHGSAKLDGDGVLRLGAVTDFVAERVSNWAKEHQREPQNPFYSGPQAARTLALAVRGDDVETLLKNRILSDRFTAALREELLALLPSLNSGQTSDRMLQTRLRRFLSGELEEEVFIPYIQQELALRRQKSRPAELHAPFTPEQATASRGEWADFLKVKPSVTNSIEMEFVLIPPGNFVMGTSIEKAKLLASTFGNDPLQYSDEVPENRIRITQPFYIGIHEVTRKQFATFVSATNYKTVADRNGGAPGWNSETGRLESAKPSYSWMTPGWPNYTNEHPVVNVAWEDAAAFCEWLSKKEGKKYQLPTEAQWEYFSAAGSENPFYFGNPETILKNANVADKSAVDAFRGALRTAAMAGSDGFPFTSPVGKFAPNAFGLHDVAGNVAEFVADQFYEDQYLTLKGEMASDPICRTGDGKRGIRGGSWMSPLPELRTAYRSWVRSQKSSVNVGFRVSVAVER